MTVTSASTDFPPGGIYDTDFAGTFTGPANSFRLDDSTNYWFAVNAGILAGGATQVFLTKPGKTSRATAATGPLLRTDQIVFATGGIAGITLTLPNPALFRNQSLSIKKVDAGAGAVTIVPFGAETIDGAPSASLPAQYQSVPLFSDGTNWHIL